MTRPQPSQLVHEVKGHHAHEGVVGSNFTAEATDKGRGKGRGKGKFDKARRMEKTTRQWPRRVQAWRNGFDELGRERDAMHLLC